jgi:peptidoglycan/xylan/chitin deacetylase (PgdA/CDA1 family)
MTRYIASYDTEAEGCLSAVHKIVAMHERFEMPATFFVVGEVLHRSWDEFHRILENSLFEVATHTLSHKMVRDHPFCGPAVSPAEIREEIISGKQMVEDVFQRPCVGLRPGCGFDVGLRGAADVLSIVNEAGFEYVSSQAWGPDYTLPAPLHQPYRYEEDGYPDLWEIPCHGWHENILKNHNDWGARRVTLWPPQMPEAIPSDFLKDAAEEFGVNKIFLDKALADSLPFVSLIWHPWSLDAFDPDMRMLELTFEHVRDSALQPCTYQQFCGDLRAGTA